MTSVLDLIKYWSMVIVGHCGRAHDMKMVRDVDQY